MKALSEWRRIKTGCVNAWDLAHRVPDEVIIVGHDPHNAGRRWRTAGGATGLPHQLPADVFVAEMPDGYAPLPLTSGERVWVPVPPAEAQRPCSETVTHHGAWASWSPCDRAATPGDSMCAMHRGHKSRGEARDAARREEYRQRQEGYERDRLQTAELQELWATVCEQRDVTRPGKPPRVSDGRATVDHEVLAMLLRELTHLG